MFIDLDWPLNASSLLSASAELLVVIGFDISSPWPWPWPWDQSPWPWPWPYYPKALALALTLWPVSLALALALGPKSLLTSLHQIIWEDAPRPCGYDHMIKSWNRKLIRVTSSNECLKHMCVDLSDYKIYLNQIWHRIQIPHYQHAGLAKFINSRLDTDIYTKVYRKMHHGHAEMTSWPKVETGS